MEKRTKHFGQKYLIHKIFGESKYTRFKFFKIHIKYLSCKQYEITGLLKKILSAGDVFFDIGANLGQYGIRLCRQRRRGIKLYLFEPVRKNYGMLSRYFKGFDNVKVENLAVSDFTGESKLKIPLIGMIRIDTQAALESTDRETGFSEYTTEQAKVITVDDYLEMNGIERLDFLKSDTEGGDEKVILGARRSISKHLPFIFTEDRLKGASRQFLADTGYREYSATKAGYMIEYGSEQANKTKGIINDVVIYLHGSTAIKYKTYIHTR